LLSPPEEISAIISRPPYIHNKILCLHGNKEKDKKFNIREKKPESKKKPENRP
jgi:hypothetical protein